MRFPTPHAPAAILVALGVAAGTVLASGGPPPAVEVATDAEDGLSGSGEADGSRQDPKAPETRPQAILAPSRHRTLPAAAESAALAPADFAEGLDVGFSIGGSVPTMPELTVRLGRFDVADLVEPKGPYVRAALLRWIRDYVDPDEWQQPYARLEFEGPDPVVLLACRDTTFTETITFLSSIRGTLAEDRETRVMRERVEREAPITNSRQPRETALAIERAERLGRVRAFFREADLAFGRGEFEESRAYLVAVLQEDPTDFHARRLIDLSRAAQHHGGGRGHDLPIEGEWRAEFEKIAEEAMPQTCMGGAPIPSEAQTRATIVASLEAQRLRGLTFKDANLDQVVTYLKSVTGLAFRITPKVRVTKFGDVSITVPLFDDVSASELLNFVTQPYDLRWEPKRGVVTIETKDEVGL